MINWENEKIRLAILCETFAQQMIHIICQALFACKSDNNNNDNNDNKK